MFFQYKRTFSFFAAFFLINEEKSLKLDLMARRVLLLDKTEPH